MARSALDQLKIDAAKKLEADINKRIVALLKSHDSSLYALLENQAIKDMQEPKKRTKKTTDAPSSSTGYSSEYSAS